MQKLSRAVLLTAFSLGFAFGPVVAVPYARAEMCGGAFSCVGMIGYIYVSWTQMLNKETCQAFERAFMHTGIPDVNSIQKLAGSWQLWQQDQIEAHVDQFVDVPTYEGEHHQGPCSAISSEPSGIMNIVPPGARVKILGYRVFTAHSPKHSNDPVGPGPSELLFALVQIESD